MSSCKMIPLNTFLYIILSVLFVYICITMIFWYLIKRNKMKPNKLSRFFYEDDEDFVSSYEKIKEKGMRKYMIENVIFLSIEVGILGVFYYIKDISFFGFERNKIIVAALAFGAVLGLIHTFIDWNVKKDRYLKIEEKRKQE